MKKVLFATTALMATAGVAMADVDLSGSASMGIFGGDGIETQFETDIDVNFSLSGQTDGGLTFGASIDLDESDGDPSRAFSSSTQGGETIFVSGNFGTLTMGDTDGAFDWALSEAIIGSAITDDHEHAGYSGNSGLDGTYDGQIARYDYSFGDFSVAASAEIDDTGAGDAVFGLGVRYRGSLAGLDLGVGLGYQTTTGADIFGVSVSTDFDNGLELVLNYSDLDGVGGAESNYGIAVGYQTGALLVAANYNAFDLVGGGETSGFGVIANYDLGGGAELQAGYGYSDFGAAGDSDSFSFGLSMSF